jgi:RNA recognition motif-containing protein
VGGLPISADCKSLKNYFSQFGQVTHANVVYHHETLKSRGFGFIVFKQEYSVDEVLVRHDDHYLEGKWIDCKRAMLKDLVQIVVTRMECRGSEEIDSQHSGSEENNQHLENQQDEDDEISSEEDKDHDEKNKF